MLVTRGSRLPHRPHLPLTACAVTVGPTKMASYQPREGATPPGPSWARVPTMRTLHVGLRVSNLDPSLAFYRAVGYTVTGTVEGTPFGNLTMLQLPGDPFVTIELVHNPAKGKVELGTGINHLVIQVESLDAALADLAVSPPRPAAHRGEPGRGRPAPAARRRGRRGTPQLGSGHSHRGRRRQHAARLVRGRARVRQPTAAARSHANT